MQRRPLHQVLVRRRQLPAMFAHCVTANVSTEPRLTITSHREKGEWLWYLGGQLADDGAGRTRDEQIAHARAELERCVGWLDWRDADFETLLIDRAEPRQDQGRRPDEAYLGGQAPLLVCWPTKLSLAPDLGEQLLARLPAPEDEPPVPALPLPPCTLDRAPWSS